MHNVIILVNTLNGGFHDLCLIILLIDDDSDRCQTESYSIQHTEKDYHEHFQSSYSSIFSSQISNIFAVIQSGCWLLLLYATETTQNRECRPHFYRVGSKLQFQNNWWSLSHSAWIPFMAATYRNFHFYIVFSIYCHCLFSISQPRRRPVHTMCNMNNNNNNTHTRLCALCTASVLNGHSMLSVCITIVSGTITQLN